MDSLKDADGNYPVVTVERGDRVLRGELVYLSFDSAAVRQTEPVRGGCVRMKIHPPYDKGFLVDKDGQINEYGAEFIGSVLVELDTAATKIQKQLPVIRDALRLVRQIQETTDLLSLTVAVHDAIGDQLNVDLPLFTSTLEEWMDSGLFELEVK